MLVQLAFHSYELKFTGYRIQFNICHPEVFNTCKIIQRCVSQTQQNFIMFIIVLGQHVSILTESPSGPSKKIDPDLKCLKMRCGIPNTYILDKTMYKVHVSFCFLFLNILIVDLFS